jgi:hypothetical protein
MSDLASLYSILYTVVVGGIFVYFFIFVYDLLYGEKREKQIRKIHKYFRKENIKKIDLMDHEPKEFTSYHVVTDKGVQKIKIKPGYKIVKIVAKKQDSAATKKGKLFGGKSS